MANRRQLHSLIDGTLVPVSGPAFTAAADAERALAVAQQIHESGAWRRFSAEQRCDILAEAQARLDDQVVERMAKADAAETGVPISITRMINTSLKEAFARDALQPLCAATVHGALRTTHGRLQQTRRPYGPALILAPWNVPSGTVVGKIIAALIAGCPVIVKPSEVAPTGLEIFLRAVSDTGLPRGVLQWIHGGPDTGAALVGDVRISVVHFTGSAEVGKTVAGACAERLAPVLMECGGSNAAIVLRDADLDAACAAVASGITMLNGQWCAGISRVFAHSSILDEVVKGVLGNFSKMKVGLAEDDATELGPLSHDAHCERLRARCQELQARGGCLLGGGEPPAPGHFLLPTLVTGVKDHYQVGELFGPVATVQPFEEDAEAVQAANRQAQLQSYIFSKDADKAIDLGSELSCGSVMVNGVGFGFEGVTGEDGQPCEPAFGFFGAAGLGEEAGGTALVRFFAGVQTVGVNG